MQDLYCVDVGSGQAGQGYPCVLCKDKKINQSHTVETHGVDMYNQSITGNVTMSITGAATDSHHIPCVIITEEDNTDED